MLSFYTVYPIPIASFCRHSIVFYILTPFSQIIGKEIFPKENVMCFKYATCSKIIFILEISENMYMGEVKFTCEPIIPQI